MTDPVTRAARRQSLFDRITEHLTAWGCPPEFAASRAATLLHVVEVHGWALPVVDAPPLTGRGSTQEGRDRARQILLNTRAGCRCGTDVVPLPPADHPVGCPVRDAQAAAEVESIRLARQAAEGVGYGL